MSSIYSHILGLFFFSTSLEICAWNFLSLASLFKNILYIAYSAQYDTELEYSKHD